MSNGKYAKKYAKQYDVIATAMSEIDEPMTVNQIKARTAKKVGGLSTVRYRVNEMAKAGKVVEQGKKGSAVLWVLADGKASQSKATNALPRKAMQSPAESAVSEICQRMLETAQEMTERKAALQAEIDAIDAAMASVRGDA